MFRNKLFYIIILLGPLISNYLIGFLEFRKIESDIVVDPSGYSLELKKSVLDDVKYSIRRNDYSYLEKKMIPNKGRIAVMITDFYNFKIYYDSLENYKFIQYSKPSEKLTWEINESKYEIIISGVKRKSWNSSFKHWMKYFIRTFRSSNKYHWITLLYFQLLGVWAFGLFVYFNYRKSQN